MQNSYGNIRLNVLTSPFCVAFIKQNRHMFVRRLQSHDLVAFREGTRPQMMQSVIFFPDDVLYPLVKSDVAAVFCKQKINNSVSCVQVFI